MKRWIHKSPLMMMAHNTYLDSRHNRVLHLAAIFAAILILFSLFLGEVSLFQNVKVVKDIGMAAISLLGVFVAIFLGVNSLYKELERRTIYSIISKPVRRADILLGRFLGMALVLGLVVIMMTIYLYLVTAFMESVVDFSLLPAILLIYMELLIVAAVAILFSSFSTPFLSGFFTLGVFIVGRSSRTLADFGERSRNEAFKLFASSVQKVFDLEPFNLRSTVVHGLPVYREDVISPVLYALLFSALVLLIAYSLFKKRDFK